MFLYMTDAGTPVWRIKYRLGKKENIYSVGPYRDVGLEAARAERTAVKGRLREGRDPVKVRQLNNAMAVDSSGNTFEVVARPRRRPAAGLLMAARKKSSSGSRRR